jgi:hypothetical protein
MTNESILNQTFDLTSILGADAVNSPQSFFVSINNQLGSFVMPTILIVFGIILFVLAKRYTNVAEAEAASYAGMIISFATIFLFTITVDGVKMLTWTQALPIYIVTSFAIGIWMMSRKY